MTAQTTPVPVRVTPSMYPMITRPVDVLRQTISGLLSALKSAAAIGTQAASAGVAAGQIVELDAR